jgi:hypothetical protein
MHFINKSFEFENIIIGFEYMPGEHSNIIFNLAAKKIYDKIKEVLKEYKIDHNIISITGDNCNTNISFANLVENDGILFMGCSAHIINLMLENSFVDYLEILQNVKELVTKVRKSPKLFSALNKEAEEDNLVLKKFRTSVKTRWNSQLYMIQSVLDNKEVLINTVTELKTIVEKIDIEKLKELKEILEPFEDCIKFLSSSKFPTIAILFRVIRGMYKHLDDLEKNKKYKQIAINMKKVLKKYYSELNNSIIYGSLLNPNLKDRFINEYFTESKDEIIMEFKGIYKNYYDKNSNIDSNKINISKKNKNIKKIIEDTSSDEENENINEDKIFQEYKSYMIEKRTKNVDVLYFWRINQIRFPILAQIARDYLSISSTSVPSERCFSRSGFIVNKYRNRLSPLSIKSNILLNDWLKLDYLENEELLFYEDDEISNLDNLEESQLESGVLKDNIFSQNSINIDDFNNEVNDDDERNEEEEENQIFENNSYDDTENNKSHLRSNQLSMINFNESDNEEDNDEKDNQKFKFFDPDNDEIIQKKNFETKNIKMIKKINKNFHNNDNLNLSKNSLKKKLTQERNEPTRQTRNNQVSKFIICEKCQINEKSITTTEFFTISNYKNLDKEVVLCKKCKEKYEKNYLN